MSENKVLFRFKINSTECKGEFWIEENPYGVSLFVKGANLDENGVEKSVLGIDLYYGSPMVQCSHDPRPLAQLVIDSSEDDPIGHVRLFEKAVAVALEYGLDREGDLIGNRGDIEEVRRLTKKIMRINSIVLATNSENDQGEAN